MKMDVFPPNTKYSTQTHVGIPTTATDKRSHLQKILIADRELSLCNVKRLPEKYTAFDRGSSCVEINNNTVFDALGSPISIRTDLSLDEASVFSPSVIPISIDCSNDDSLSPTTSDHIVASPRHGLDSSIADSNVTCTFVELSPLVNSTGNQPQSENVEPDSLVNSTESQTQSENVDLSHIGTSMGNQTQTEKFLNKDLTETDCIVTETLTTSLHLLNNNTTHICTIAQIQPVSNSVNSQLLLNIDSNSIGTDHMYVDKRNYPVASNPIVNARGICSSSTKHHSNGFSKLPAPHSTGNGSPIFEKTHSESEVPKQKRRRKRRKLDLGEPPLPPALTVLPPCEVCGHKSSGFHYGANTCEACKGFFRRTLKKNEVTFQCVCSEEERREFQQENRVGKNMCPACRYQQCLAIGMSRNAIKIGRYSIQKKTENICQVKTLEEDRNSTERSSLIPNTNANRTTKHALSSENKGVNSPSSSSENSAILNLYLSNDQTDTGSPSGDSEYGFTGRKNRSAGELTLKEIDTYVKTLYHAHKSLLVKAETFIQVDQLKRHQREYFEQYQLKRQLFGTMGYVSKEEYFELYNSTGIEIDNRKEMVQEATNYFEEKIAKLVEFAKCIPGFRELQLQDQANLIKGSRIDCGLLGLLHHPFNPDNNVTTTPWGRNVHIDEVGRILSKDFLFAKFRIRCMVEKLELSPEEEAVLTAVLVTFTDRCELIDAEKVQNIQYKLVTCLEYLIKIRPTNQPNKFWRVFSFLMAMRNVSEWEAEMIQQISLDWPTIAMNPEKLESCVIGGLRQSM